MRENDHLLRLIAAVTEGEVVDWQHERKLAEGEDRALLRALELVAELADLHRAHPDDTVLLPGQQVAFLEIVEPGSCVRRRRRP